MFRILPSMKKYATTATVCGALLGALAACGGDDDASTGGPEKFKVTIENVFSARSHGWSEVFAVPVGATQAGAIGAEGDAYELSFFAAPGQAVSFASMLVSSNDFFFAPGPGGIALYDDAGNPIVGDVTSQVSIWDAGTEANEALGMGANQPANQSGPNTGDPDSDSRVRLAVADGLPAVDDVIEVTLAPTPNTHRGFTLRIEVVSGEEIDGNPAYHLAPGVAVVHTASAPLFSEGSTDTGLGLEALAEDGDPSTLGAALAADSGLVSPFAPGVWAVHAAGEPLFTAGEDDRGDGLQALAEDGSPTSLASALGTDATVTASGAFTTPTGATDVGPAFPGESYSFVIDSASPGDRLSFATMLVQSNDLFVAPNGAGIAFFDANGMPRTGDITSELALWDAGSEINQAPGVGADQAPRQSAADTGDADPNTTVRRVDDGFSYPAVSAMVRVTLSVE